MIATIQCANLLTLAAGNNSRDLKHAAEQRGTKFTQWINSGAHDLALSFDQIGNSQRSTGRRDLTAGRSLAKGTMTAVSMRMAHLKRCMTWGGCPCMPSAPPSSADSRNTPKAMKGKTMVVSDTVKSVNQAVPPSISEGICKTKQICQLKRSDAL